MKLEHFLQFIQKHSRTTKIAVNSLTEIHYINLENIICLRAESNYTDIILDCKQKITSCKSLKEYEDSLNPNTFFRTCKSYIINIQQVERFIKTDGGYLIMKEGYQIPVSRQKKKELLEILGKQGV